MLTSDDEDDNENYTKKTKDEYAKKRRRCESTKRYRDKIKKLNLPFDSKTLLCSTLNQDSSIVACTEEVMSEIQLNKPIELSSSSSDENDSNETSVISFNNNDQSDFESVESSDSDVNNEAELYKNSSTSVESLINSVLSLMFKHRMSDEGAKDYLKLIKSTLPTPNKCPGSIKAIYDYILKDRENLIIRHYFCKNCQVCNMNTQCETCKSENIYFITLDVPFQIKSIINRPNIRQEIIQNRKYKSSNSLASCQDGAIYQDYLKTTNYDLNISLCLNTDGAPVIVSKSFSLWPVMAKIVELPDKVSESFENLIFVGLWLDNVKPNSEIFISKCVEAIMKAINEPSLKKLGKFQRCLKKRFLK
jgi:hypothetical protein